jgi:hypothetical protein
MPTSVHPRQRRKTIYLDTPVFTVTFKKGRARNNRLPLAHVLATLQELDFMIREVGTQIQRDRGIENPDGDFGIELLAGASGVAFGKGSVKATALITRDTINGVESVNRVISTTDDIEKKKPGAVDEYGEYVLRRLPRISDIQEKDGTELRLQLAENGKITNQAKFSENGVKVIRSMSEAEFAVEHLTLYGKLRQLKDSSKDEEHSRYFWGELLEDNGNIWRIRFKRGDMRDVLPLFTKQVAIFGDANYFKTKNPRLDALTIKEDQERDYVAAFDDFRSAYGEIFQDRDPEVRMVTLRNGHNS